MRRLFLFMMMALLAFSAGAQRREIHILSANDMHAAIERMPQVAAIADSLRSLYPSLLVFSAGDNRTGEPLNDMYETPAYPMVALMNLIGFNGSALGNHEFDVGSLPRLMGLSAFRYICANITADDSTGIRTVPCQIFDVEGLRVGVIGVVQLNKWGRPDTHPNNLHGVRFEEPVATVGCYEWLSRQTDATILLSHVGYADDLKMAEKYSWIDLIIGGHSHTQLTADEPLHNGVLITQNANRLPMVTHIVLGVDSGRVVDKRVEYINVPAFATKNKVAEQMVHSISANPEFQRVLARAEAPFTCIDELGSMVCDAFIDGTGADISIENRRGIRAETHPAGDLKVLDVLQIDPFGNSAVELYITGEELLQFVASYSRMSITHFPHLGGIRAELTLSPQDSATITRIKLLTLKGRRLDMKKTYKVVTNSYVAATYNGDMDAAHFHVLNLHTADLIMRFLEKRRTVNYQGVRRIKYRYP